MVCVTNYLCHSATARLLPSDSPFRKAYINQYPKIQTLNKPEEIWNWTGLIEIGIILSISILSYYLGIQMFPNYGLLGPDKDENGSSWGQSKTLPPRL